MPPVYFYNAKEKKCEEILIEGIPLGGLKNETYDILNKKFQKLVQHLVGVAKL